MATNKLSKENIIALYEYLCEYEKEIKPYPESYDYMNDGFQRFIRQNNIFLNSLAPTHRKTAQKKGSNYILYDSKRNTSSGKDKVHHLLRHIRNSIAHGQISKERKSKKVYYRLIDKNKSGNDSMISYIEEHFFYQIINQLIKTKE